MAPMHPAMGVMLTKEKPRATLSITDAQSVVVLLHGESPIEFPTEGAGDYWCDALELGPNVQWPIVFLVVPRAHVGAFQRMSPEKVNALLRDALQTSSEPKGTEGGRG